VERVRPNPLDLGGLAGEAALWGAVETSRPDAEGAIREVVGRAGTLQWWPLSRVKRSLGLLGRRFRLGVPVPPEQLARLVLNVCCGHVGGLGCQVCEMGRGYGCGMIMYGYEWTHYSSKHDAAA
jgi:hypothetical protein